VHSQNAKKFLVRQILDVSAFPYTKPAARRYLQTESNLIVMSSPKQIEANRANSLLSTGPTSSAGKAKVAHNAVKTGLTGRTVLLPSDDVAAYQAHVERVFRHRRLH